MSNELLGQAINNIIKKRKGRKRLSRFHPFYNYV